MSKLLTVYTFLIHEGLARDGDSVTKHIPELAEIAKGDLVSDNGRLVNWTDVTVGDLASQLGGITRDRKWIRSYEVAADVLMTVRSGIER